jgi:hypothetical protein
VLPSAGTAVRSTSASNPRMSLRNAAIVILLEAEAQGPIHTAGRQSASRFSCAGRILSVFVPIGRQRTA